MAYPTDALKSAISSASAQATSAYAGLSGVVNGADVLSSQLDGLKNLVPALQSALNVLSNSSFYAPVGLVAPFGGVYSNIPPSGWLFCDGSVVSQTTYADLFTVIGSSYNTSGEGSGNFRLPDLRGRVAIGQTQYVSPSAPALGTDANGSTLTSRNHGTRYGAESLPSHFHTASASSVGNHTHGYYQQPGYTAASYAGSGIPRAADNNAANGGYPTSTDGGGAHGHTITVDPTGTGTHGVVQPSLALSFIIKY